MNKKIVIAVFAILGFITLWVAKKNADKKMNSSQTGIESNSANSYFTCPMHPQIHLDHEGECPICHMKLVKVLSVKQKTISEAEQKDKRSSVEASPDQLRLIGIHKTAVQKMNLTARIPISGRILNESSVAFQIYEKDLRSVKTGYKFIGESSGSVVENIQGFVTSIDSIVDPTSRTVRVVGKVNKTADRLLSETSFSGYVEVDLKNRLAIPESAVLHTGRADLVYIFGAENTLTAKAVKLGIKTEGFYEVLSGINENDSISSGPNFLIDSEAKIRGAND